MKSKSNVLPLMGLVVLFAGQTAHGADPWWNYDWTCRRAVKVASYEPTRLGGSDVAFVTMPTAEKIRPGAVDIRVTTNMRKEVPHQILMVGPGDQVSIAFALQRSVRDYFVYFGNPKAAAPEQELQIKRGVLLSTWVYPGGGTGNMKQIDRIFQRAKVFVGRRFVDRIFMGYDPFGPQQRLARIFEAYLICPQTGKYIFSSSSRNASFLLLDDKLVVSNGGLHSPQPNISKRGSVDLTAGLHKLTFYHVSPRRDPVVVAAWRPPGQTKVTIIPPGAFAPVHSAAPGAMEEIGKLSVDFIPVHAGETFMKGRYYQRYTFEASALVANRRVKQWQWDFGDGQKATGPSAEHIYLKDGTYTVTLTGKISAGTLGRTNRVHVSRPWDKIILNKLDPIRDYGSIVAGYDFQSLPPAHLGEAMMLFQRLAQTEQVMAVGAAAASKKPLPGILAGLVLSPYVDALASAGRAEEAVAMLARALAATEDPSTTTLLLVYAGRVTLDNIDQPAKAEAIFARAIREGVMTQSPALRDARIGIGDTWRARGDYDKAASAYRDAGTKSARKDGGTAMARGDLARHVEDYVRRGAYSAASEKLNEWRLAFPADKLEGYWSLLQARLLLARGQYAAAVHEAEILIGVNPKSYHAPALIMLAYEAHRKAGQTDKAAATLKRLVRDYAESALAARAAEILKAK